MYILSIDILGDAIKRLLIGGVTMAVAKRRLQCYLSRKSSEIKRNISKKNVKFRPKNNRRKRRKNWRKFPLNDRSTLSNCDCLNLFIHFSFDIVHDQHWFDGLELPMSEGRKTIKKTFEWAHLDRRLLNNSFVNCSQCWNIWHVTFNSVMFSQSWHFWPFSMHLQCVPIYRLPLQKWFVKMFHTRFIPQTTQVIYPPVGQIQCVRWKYSMIMNRIWRREPNRSPKSTHRSVRVISSNGHKNSKELFCRLFIGAICCHIYRAVWLHRSLAANMWSRLVFFCLVFYRCWFHYVFNRVVCILWLRFVCWWAFRKDQFCRHVWIYFRRGFRPRNAAQCYRLRTVEFQPEQFLACFWRHNCCITCKRGKWFSISLA